MKTIARVYTDLPEKFGLPRQSMLADRLCGEIVFEKEYRDPNAVRGMEGFDYLWIIWVFENGETGEEAFRPMVRPPRLGGNEYMGVFATRSPFRPNPVGLSCVKLEEIRFDEERGPVIVVSGVDMRSGTAVLDIKPYLPYCEAHPEARSGFAGSHAEDRLQVFIGEGEESVPFSEENPVFPAEWNRARIEALFQLLSQDPRPAYHDDPDRIYGLTYAERNISFRVAEGKVHLLKIS